MNDLMPQNGQATSEARPLFTNRKPDPLTNTATAGVEAIHLIVSERDHLREACDRQNMDLALARQKLEQLERSLTLTTSERDHYMRHSAELCAQLNNITVTINEALRVARDEAYRPNGGMPKFLLKAGAPSEAERKSDEEKLSALAAALAPEPYEAKPADLPIGPQEVRTPQDALQADRPPDVRANPPPSFLKAER